MNERAIVGLQACWYSRWSPRQVVYSKEIRSLKALFMCVSQLLREPTLHVNINVQRFSEFNHERNDAPRRREITE